MELKVLCDCGQKFKFDVEPVDGKMPFTLNCPACNEDATAAANALIAEQITSAPPATVAEISPPPPIAPVASGLRINRSAPEAATAPPAVTATFTPPPISGLKPATAPKVRTQDFSLVRGIIGAVIGAVVGCGLMFAFAVWAQFRFPFMGIAVGAASGYMARWLARGTDKTLGIITAVIAGGLVTGTFVLMYGEFAFTCILSIVVCIAVSYRVSAD